MADEEGGRVTFLETDLSEPEGVEALRQERLDVVPLNDPRIAKVQRERG
jgi:hypothetical protein